MEVRTHNFKPHQNPTEISPKGNRVLVQMERVSETTDGGLIHKPVETIVREEMAQIFGTLVECGSYAWKDYPEPYAQPGDRVIISKYSGILLDTEGSDKYRLIQDSEILATKGAK